MSDPNNLNSLVCRIERLEELDEEREREMEWLLQALSLVFHGMTVSYSTGGSSFLEVGFIERVERGFFVVRHARTQKKERVYFDMVSGVSP